MKTLSDLAGVDDDFKKEFIDLIKGSGLSWLTLARINLVASNSMEKVLKNINTHMSNLPTKNDALEIVKDLSNSMLKDLNEEEKLLEE
jgi:hypothetical protein